MDFPLPNSSEVAVDRLAGCFAAVTNSYKFFWFLSLLEHTQTSPERVIRVSDLIAQMMALVWYPANYYRLHFGKQDQLRLLAEQLQQTTGLVIDAKPARVKAAALKEIRGSTLMGRNMLQLGNYVPYRFLRPFVSEPLRGLADWRVNDAVVAEANDAFATGFAEVPYRFIDGQKVELSSTWQRYLAKHHEILTGFCLWHLSNYIQRNNPNVSNIAQKLFLPEQRDMRLGRRFWKVVLENNGPVLCIYSGKLIRRDDFSLDHFLPWRFVAHDLLWNLIPTPKEINSAKSDCLPDGQLYFDSFAQLQYQGLRAVAEAGKASLLEDYILLLRLEDVELINSLSYLDFRKGLYDAVISQMQIAKNMGFRTNWRYSSTLNDRLV